MADVHDKLTRSYNMSQIKGKDTKPELLVRKYLFSKGLRYRLHNNKLPGKPDLTLPKYRIVIFVNGCFWHGHKNCKYFKLPSTRKEWWKQKIYNNINRDKEDINSLEKIGFRVLTVWECELKPSIINSTLIKLYNKIKDE